jgi:hypothetical protein
LDGLSRHRSPWFRRPARDDLPVSGAMIIGTASTILWVSNPHILIGLRRIAALHQHFFWDA